MPRSADFSRFEHDDLVRALHQLVASKKLSSQDVRRAVEDAREISTLERRLASLRGGASGGAARAADRPSAPRRTVTMTPKMKAARKLQGQYLGRLKKLTGADRARVKAAAKKDGVAQAVKLADQILG